MIEPMHHINDEGLSACGRGPRDGSFATKSVSMVTCKNCLYEMGAVQCEPTLEDVFSSIPFLQHIKELFNAAIDYEMKRLKKGD